MAEMKQGAKGRAGENEEDRVKKRKVTMGAKEKL